MSQPKFKIGDVVYQRVNTDNKGVVTGQLKKADGWMYQVSWSTLEDLFHYDFELTQEKTFEGN